MNMPSPYWRKKLACITVTLSLAGGATASFAENPAPRTDRSRLRAMMGERFTGVPRPACSDYSSYPAGDKSLVFSADCSGRGTIWLAKPVAAANSSKDTAGEMEVVDQVVLRPLAGNELFLSGPYCYDRDKKEVLLSAIFRWGKNKKMQPGSRVIVEAWMPDSRNEGLIAAPQALILHLRCSASEDE